jgi:hypothetical protein
VLSPSSAVCGSRWRRTWPLRGLCNVSAANASATRSATANTPLGASSVMALTSLVSARHPVVSLSAAAAGAALANRTPTQGRKTIATGNPAAPKAKPATLSDEQVELGVGWSHVFRGRVVKASTPSPISKPISQPVTGATNRPQVTAAGKKAKPEMAQPKTSAPLERPPLKPRKRQPRVQNLWRPLNRRLIPSPPLHRSRVSQISSTTFPLTPVWS